MPSPFVPARWVGFAFGLLALAGCAPEPEVRSYTVPREADHKPFRPGAVGTEAKYRMLTAVIPINDNLSFFVRFDGPIDKVNEAEAEFDAFLMSIRLTGQPTPPLTWTVPPGWRVGPPKQFRLVTIQKGDEKKPLEAYISDPLGGSMLSNVNRWRTDFVGVKPWDEEELKDGGKKILLGGTPAFRFDFAGPGGAKANTGGRPFGSTN